MKILIGYSMRSGSTLLQHILDGHSTVRSFSDLSSFWALARLAARWKPRRNICVKPMDVFYLRRTPGIYRFFDKFVWIARDPRDSYLSSVESGYAYLVWPKGRKVEGVDTGLLERWRRVYNQLFRHRDMWHLVKYEELTTTPDKVIRELLQHLELPPEKLLPFNQFRLVKGGDAKIRKTRTVHNKSSRRHQRELNPRQLELFQRIIGPEMRELGYLP